AIEATSKCVIPDSHRIWRSSGEGFALTAYIDLPGNFSAKKRAARAAACGRLRITGSSGERALTTALASGNWCNSRDLQWAFRPSRHKAALRFGSPHGAAGARDIFGPR